MNSVTETLAATATQTVLLYGRNSTDEQAEAGTIQNQQSFLRDYAQLYGLRVAGEFWDEGISGTVAIANRPDGARLLEAAQSSRGATILVYRLDRLGRSLRALLEAHEALEAAGVTIRSATEPFDTATSIGKFLFQLLGSLAELERSTILERTTLGRDRVAQDGKWTGGPVPYGYELDATGRLAASTRPVDCCGKTEAEVAAEIITNIANGASATGEAIRLTALGAPSFRRYASGKAHESPRWTPSRVLFIARNPAYMGLHTVKSRRGDIQRAVTALVDRETWTRAQQQLTTNRLLATRNAKRTYLLRGLVQCACTRAYVGMCSGDRNKGTVWYRCMSHTGAAHSRGYARCNGKSVKGDRLEALVWEDCAAFIRNPGDRLAEAQRQLRDRLARVVGTGDERARIQQALAGKEAERERVMTLFRRGHASLDDAERQLDDVGREAEALRAQLAALRSDQDLAHAFEAQVTEASTLLVRLRGQLAAIEDGLASEDAQRRAWARERQRESMASLVASITIRTEGVGLRTRQPIAEIRYTFGRPSAVVMDTAAATEDYRTLSVCRDLLLGAVA